MAIESFHLWFPACHRLPKPIFQLWIGLVAVLRAGLWKGILDTRFLLRFYSLQAAAAEAKAEGPFTLILGTDTWDVGRTDTSPVASCHSSLLGS